MKAQSSNIWQYGLIARLV